MSNIATIAADAPDPALIRQAVQLLRQGGMVVFPTRHLYGLGVDALDPGAVARIFAVKRRSPRQPLLILAASREDVHRYATRIDARATTLMDAFWPGKLTIVLEARAVLPAVLTGQTGRIGIRVPEHRVARAILRGMGTPITGTSANLSGKPGCRRIENLAPPVAAAADLILDTGPLIPGVGSSVVDIRPEGIHLLREGAISRAALEDVSGSRVSTQSMP